MKQSIFEIIENRPLTKNVFLMRLSGDTSDITAPGQFVNLKLDGFFLRRPISVCDSEDGVLTLIYKVVGRGTEYMSKMQVGEKIDILTGLGNGYDTTVSGDSPLLVGGGVGGALVEVPLTAHMGITASFLSSCPSCRYPCHFHLIKDILQ